MIAVIRDSRQQANHEGHVHPLGHRPRRLLPPHLAGELAQAHEHTGWSYREAAAMVGIDFGYYGRLLRGERCPSVDTSERLIEVLGLHPLLARELLRVSVVRPRV